MLVLLILKLGTKAAVLTQMSQRSFCFALIQMLAGLF